jgi:hypothetical protein
MRRKFRRLITCAVMIAAITATPVISACHQPAYRAPLPPVVHAQSYIVFVKSLDMRVLGDSDRYVSENWDLSEAVAEPLGSGRGRELP